MTCKDVFPLRNKNRRFKKDDSKRTKKRISLWIRVNKNPKFVKAHKLHINSHPDECMRAFLPSHRLLNANRNLNISPWTTYTNLKAILINAGQLGSIYPISKTFKKRYIYIYILAFPSRPNSFSSYWHEVQNPTGG